MTTNDPELDVLQRYRNFRPAPIVDVAQRVCDMINGLPPRAGRANRWAMAASAVICAAMAASIAFAAALRPADTGELSSTLVDLVIDTHQVDVQSMLP